MAIPVTYTPPELDPSVVYDMGVNAPKYHQRTIARLTAGLYPLYRQGSIPYEPLPETMVGEYSSPTPDLILFDSASETTKVIIEICQTIGLKADVKKVIELIDGELYGVEEGFVYNYKTFQWLRYRKGDEGQATETSYSDVLNLDLNTYL